MSTLQGRMTGTWLQISRENFKAAQLLRKAGFPRSSVSRSYYAAFSAVTHRLETIKPQMFGPGRESPPHSRVPHLLGQIPGMKAATTISLRSKIRRVYNNRLQADYKSKASVDEATARDVLRDSFAICKALGVFE